jgi:hypothetical protein
MATTHNFSTAGKATCTGMTASEEHTLFFKLIGLWYLYDRIIEKEVIRIARVIRHDKNDVWSRYYEFRKGPWGI